MESINTQRLFENIDTFIHPVIFNSSSDSITNNVIERSRWLIGYDETGREYGTLIVKTIESAEKVHVYNLIVEEKSIFQYKCKCKTTCGKTIISRVIDGKKTVYGDDKHICKPVELEKALFEINKWTLLYEEKQIQINQYKARIAGFTNIKLDDLAIVPNDMWYFGYSKKGVENANIIIFNSDDKTHCFQYLRQKAGKKYTCSSCGTDRKFHYGYYNPDLNGQKRLIATKCTKLIPYEIVKKKQEKYKNNSGKSVSSIVENVQQKKTKNQSSFRKINKPRKSNENYSLREHNTVRVGPFVSAPLPGEENGTEVTVEVDFEPRPKRRKSASRNPSVNQETMNQIQLLPQEHAVSVTPQPCSSNEISNARQDISDNNNEDNARQVEDAGNQNLDETHDQKNVVIEGLPSITLTKEEDDNGNCPDIITLDHPPIVYRRPSDEWLINNCNVLGINVTDQDIHCAYSLWFITKRINFALPAFPPRENLRRFSSGFELISSLLTGNEKNSIIIDRKLNRHIFANIQEIKAKLPIDQDIHEILFPNDMHLIHFEVASDILKCTIVIYDYIKSEKRKFGDSNDASIVVGHDEQSYFLFLSR